MPQRKLGRRAPSNKRALHLSSFLTGLTPAHPVSADHFSEINDWGLYENDKYGDCGPTSVANCIKLITKYLGGAEISPSQDDVFDLYRRSGNPNFDPTTDADDNGVDMQTMLEAVLAQGIGGRQCLAFAKVNVSNIDEVRAAIAIFGYVLYGVNLEVTQQRQTDLGGPWTYSPSAEWGGHAVLAGKYTGSPSSDVQVVTWAEVIGTSDSFATHQLEEAWVVIWPEHLNSAEFLVGVDLAALAKAYKDLTGEDFPIQPEPPLPGPTPTPVPPSPVNPNEEADKELAQEAAFWLNHTKPRGLTRDLAHSLRKWLNETGYGGS